MVDPNNPDKKLTESRKFRAIGTYASEHGLIPQLSAHPVYYFKNKQSGIEEKHNLSDILSWYDSYKKAQAKERAREKRMQKQ